MFACTASGHPTICQRVSLSTIASQTSQLSSGVPQGAYLASKADKRAKVSVRFLLVAATKLAARQSTCRHSADKVPKQETDEVLTAFAAHKGEVTEGYSAVQAREPVHT